MTTTFNNARKCAKCGHEWIRKGSEEPKRCPRCRSEKWQHGDNYCEKHDTYHIKDVDCIVNK